MDGLTISTAQGVLDTGKTPSQIKAAENKATLNLNEGEKSFASTLKDAVQEVNKMQKDADVLMQKLATGKTKNIPEVMIATEKADIAFKLMVQVRNKVIDAYQEIMKMQV